MNEIKFKVWHKRLLRMFVVYCIDWKNCLVFCEGSNGNKHTFGFVDVEIMQYVGVHDDSDTINGDLELFYGDIITLQYEGEMIIGSIESEGGRLLIASRQLDDGYAWLQDLIESDDGYYWIPDSKLIGNKYQFPALLQINELGEVVA